MAFVEDIASFFSPDDPGVVAAVIRGTTVYGSLETDLEEALDSPTRRGVPLFLCEKAALPAVAVGDVATIDARSYRVREIEMSDYDPVATLRLNNT